MRVVRLYWAVIVALALVACGSEDVQRDPAGATRVGNTKSKSYRIEAMCSLDAPKGLHDACMGKMHETAMTLAAASGKSCDMGGMDHGAMPGTDHGAMKGMDHGNMDGMKHGDMKPTDAEAMNCKEMCAMMKKSSDAAVGR